MNASDLAILVELIGRRRRQVLVHSAMYYTFGTSLWTDAQFDRAARELARVQRAFPEVAAACPFAAEFEGFEGFTGMGFAAHPWAIDKALRLLRAEAPRGAAAVA